MLAVAGIRGGIPRSHFPPMYSFLIDGIRETTRAPWLHVLIACTAALCGWIVGAERERREKPAGLRTLVLVCLGSASFTMVSFVFTPPSGDAGRVAAQIVTGIGFLGAGAILHGPGFVSGLTTAAGIWVTAAIGMIAGAGHVGGALALAIFVRLLLTGIYRWDERHIRSFPLCTVRFVMDPAHGKTRIRVEKILEDFRVQQARFLPTGTGDGHVEATATFNLPQHHRRDFLYALACIPEVLEIAEGERVTELKAES